MSFTYSATVMLHSVVSIPAVGIRGHMRMTKSFNPVLLGLKKTSCLENSANL